MAQGADFDQAFAAAYGGLDQVHFDGIHYRRDIGHQVRNRLMTSGTQATADWALPPQGGPPDDQDGVWRRIVLWWEEFSLQTKLLAIATLVVSLMMTGITFFALNGIQRDAVMNDTRYARDLGLLLAGNVTELVAQEQDRELADVAEKFWRSSRSVRYIFFADPDGVIYLGITDQRYTRRW